MTTAQTRCSILISFIAALASIGCASTTTSQRYLTSFTDPDFLGRSFTRLAVHYDTDNFGYRKAVEEEIVRALRKRGVYAVESSTVIAPTRSWDSANVADALRRNHFDGYVRIFEIDRSTSTHHVPLKQTTQVTREEDRKRTPESNGKGETDGQGSSVKVKETETTTTTTTGGYTYTVTWTAFRLELIDLAGGRIAWVASKWIEGSPGAEAEDFGRAVALQLGQDGMVTFSD